MKCLVDTHALIWFLQGDSALSSKAWSLMKTTETELYLSSVSVWEMAIKISFEKLRVPYDLDQELPDLLVQSFIDVVEPDFKDYQTLSLLPFHHRDPFDRLLIAQSLNKDLVFISRDEWVDAYGVTRVW